MFISKKFEVLKALLISISSKNKNSDRNLKKVEKLIAFRGCQGKKLGLRQVKKFVKTIEALPYIISFQIFEDVAKLSQNFEKNKTCNILDNNALKTIWAQNLSGG